jgi:hypothetical protein
LRDKRIPRRLKLGGILRRWIGRLFFHFVFSVLIETGVLARSFPHPFSTEPPNLSNDLNTVQNWLAAPRFAYILLGD